MKLVYTQYKLEYTVYTVYTKYIPASAKETRLGTRCVDDGATTLDAQALRLSQTNRALGASLAIVEGDWFRLYLYDTNKHQVRQSLKLSH